jgi:hypothetical protein
MSASRTTAAPVAATSRRVVWIAVGVLCLMALGALAWRFVPIIGPTGAAWSFCDDLTHQRYADIYGRLAAALHAQVSEQAFVDAEQLADAQAGKVTQCDASPLNVAMQGAGATAEIAEHRAEGVSVVAHLHLSGPSWQIAALPDPAVAPYATAFSFCTALLARNYAAAYRLLTPNITGQLPQANYVKLGGIADQQEGPVTVCTISQLTLSADDASASAIAQVTRQRPSPVPILLGVQNGTWYITNLPSA